jgi:hypothetical protein
MGLAVHKPIHFIRSTLPGALIWFVVVMLILLNPLACLIHCAVMDRLVHSHDTAAAVAYFLCDMHVDPLSNMAGGVLRDDRPVYQTFASSGTIASSDLEQTVTPRAVYEGIRLLSPILLLTLLFFRTLGLPALHRLPRRSDTPPLPPPRAA